MKGCIEIIRTREDCGKNLSMEICIANSHDKEYYVTLDDGEIARDYLGKGKYIVYVCHGGKDNRIDAEIKCGHITRLQTTIKPISEGMAVCDVLLRYTQPQPLTLGDVFRYALGLPVAQKIRWVKKHR